MYEQGYDRGWSGGRQVLMRNSTALCHRMSRGAYLPDTTLPHLNTSEEST